MNHKMIPLIFQLGIQRFSRIVSSQHNILVQLTFYKNVIFHLILLSLESFYRMPFSSYRVQLFQLLHSIGSFYIGRSLTALFFVVQTGTKMLLQKCLVKDF